MTEESFLEDVEIQTIERDGLVYRLLDPEEIDLDAMTPVQKVTNVFAWQVPEGQHLEVETLSGPAGDRIVETVNAAHPGDWVVYNLGNGTGESLRAKLQSADVKVIHDEVFAQLYAPLSPTEEDAEDDAFPVKISDYRDFDAVLRMGSEYSYQGREIYVARVPFHFVLVAPWGRKQFIRAGGFVVYNPSLSSEKHKEIYGTAGSWNRHPGQLEHTYTRADDGNREKIADAYKWVLRCDRSPIAGIQFSRGTMERAHERLGIETHGWEQKR